MIRIHVLNRLFEVLAVVSIPMKGLLLSTFPTIGLLGILLGGEVVGVSWNYHGGGALLVLLLFASTVLGMIVEAFLIPVSVIRLVKFPPLRTLRNIAAVSFGLAYVIGGSMWIVSDLRELWV